MTYHFRRGGNIWKEWNLSFECPDTSEIAASQNEEPSEPVIFWDSTTGSPKMEKKMVPSPLTLREENKILNSGTQLEEEASQSSTYTPSQTFPAGADNDFNTPTSHRLRSSCRRTNSVFSKKQKQPQKDKEKEDLLRKIHETAMLHLQSNVETYIKRRNEEKSKKRKNQGDDSDGEALFSPKTALERDAARFTPSKRRRFFPEARLYGSSQISTPCRDRLTTKGTDTTPKRPMSPMTSTPRCGEDHGALPEPNISPVATPRRSKRLQSRIALQENEDELGSPIFDSKKDEAEELPKESVLAGDPVAQQPASSEVYIIPDDSWDDSF